MNRFLIWILAGTGGSLVLAALDLFAGTGPIAGTLSILPLAAGLLGAARTITLPASPKPDRFFVTRLACGSVLVILALARDQLGLRYGEDLGSAVIVGGLFVLLFWQAAVGIRGLARKPDRGPRNYVAFFLIVLAVYLGVQPWQAEQRAPDGDEPYYLLLAHSLAYDLDADLANNYERGDSLAFMPRRIGPQLGDPVGQSGEKFSRHNMTLPILLALPYRLLGKFGALGLMAALTAALATMILRLAHLYYPERQVAGLLAASMAALTTPLLTYSHQAWVEVPAALLCAITISALPGLRTQETSWRWVGLLIVPLLLLPLLKLRFLALSASLLLLSLVRASQRHRSLLLRGGTTLLALTAFTFLFNEAVFGQALKHHPWQSLTAYFSSREEYLRGPLGLFFDSAFGLFFASPIWVLIIPGFFKALRSRRELIVDLVISCSPYLLLLAPRLYWYGGWSPPFRYGIAFLPLMSLLAIPMFAARRRLGVRLLLGFLLAATIALTLLWLLLPGWTYNFADGRSHLLDYLTVSFDSDVARLFPSIIRPRVANVVWLAALCTLVPALAFGLTRRASSRAVALGAAAFLLACAAVPSIARLPKGRVEFEDPYVRKSGGELWPAQWVSNRPDFRGAWTLSPQDEVEFAVTPRSGGELELTLEVRRVGPRKTKMELELLTGNRPLMRVPLPPTTDWAKLELDPVAWPDRADHLKIRFLGRQSDRVRLDRARLDWR